MFGFFKSQGFQKVIALILLVILLIAIPITIKYGAQQQQQPQQNASTHVFNNGVDSCGKIQVTRETENPSCSSGTATDTYTTTVLLTSKDGATHQVSYLSESFWCKGPSELGDGVNPTSCIKRVKTDSKTITVGAGAGVSLTSVVQKASSYGLGSSCGVFQTDFSFTVDGTSCRFGYSALDPSPAHPVLAAGYCDTGHTCSVPSVTPTAPVTPTPTIPVTPTPTTPITPTITITDTPTPTTPITPTVSDTPGPTSTPVPPTTTPKPTLPPTGPGDTIIGVGLVGAAAAAIGALVILAL